MKENPREIPTKKYPNENIPLKDPDVSKNLEDPEDKSGQDKREFD